MRHFKEQALKFEISRIAAAGVVLLLYFVLFLYASPPVLNGKDEMDINGFCTVLWRSFNISWKKRGQA